MNDGDRSKQVLEKELTELRERITELESSKAEHDRLQKEYDEIKENYKLLTENISDVIFITDSTFTLIECSKSVERISGYKIDEMVGKPFNELSFLTPESLQKTYKNVELIMSGKPLPSTEYEFIHKDGTKRIMEVKSTVFLKKGKFQKFISVARDITERKRVELKLLESKERFLQVAANAQEWIWEVDAKGRYTYAGPVVENLLGYKPEEIVGKKHFYDFFHIDDREELKNEAFKVFNQKQPFRGFINRNMHKNGKTVWLSTSSVPILDDESNLIGYRGADIDITERKETEELLKRSLEEKELLLKEIHHRVKNNIQVIASLLNLHSSYIKDEKYMETFKEIQNRLRTMALIHEQLYQSKDMANIDFGKYVKELVNSLFRFSRTNIERIRPRLDVEDLSMGLDLAIPCALIINELVLNSMKHAFDRDSSGEIGIQVGIKEESETEKKIELLIRDNGKGFPESLDFRNTGTFGLQLVITLVEQLDGSIELDRDGGTEFKINFIEKIKK